MDDVVKTLRDRQLTRPHVGAPVRPSREEAEAAVRTLLAYTGDDPKPGGAPRDPAPGRDGV